MWLVRECTHMPRHSVRKSQFCSRGFSTLKNLILFSIRFVKSLRFVISMRNTIHKIFEIYEILRFMKSVKILNSSLYPAIFHCWLSQLLITVWLNFRIFMEIMKEVNSWREGYCAPKLSFYMFDCSKGPLSSWCRRFESLRRDAVSIAAILDNQNLKVFGFAQAKFNALNVLCKIDI